MAPVQSRLVLAVGFSALATAATALFVVVGLLWRRESRRPDPDKDEPPDRVILDNSESFTDSALNESSKFIESIAEEPSKVSDSGLVSESFVSSNCSADLDASTGDFKLTQSELQSDSFSFYASVVDTPEDLSSCSLQEEFLIPGSKEDSSIEEYPTEKSLTEASSDLRVGEVTCSADSGCSQVIDSASVNNVSLEEFLLFKGFIEDSVEAPKEGLPEAVVVSKEAEKADISTKSCVEAHKEQVSEVVVVLKVAESAEIPSSDSVTEEKNTGILVEDSKKPEDVEEVVCKAVKEVLTLEVSNTSIEVEEESKEETSVETPAKNKIPVEVLLNSIEAEDKSAVHIVEAKTEDSIQEKPLKPVEDIKPVDKAVKEIPKKEEVYKVLKISGEEKPLKPAEESESVKKAPKETSKKEEVCKKVKIQTLKKGVLKAEKKQEKARKAPVTVVNNPEKKESACSLKSVEEVFVEKKMSGEVLCEKERKEGSEKGELAGLELESMKEGAEGRDSANHSPSEVMLASPSISSFSDAHSEGSSDSGKGHSDVPTSPSRTPAGGSSLAGEDSISNVYEFVIPQVIVGRLIGRHGSFLHEVMGVSHTNIYIKKHPDSNKLKICAIEGGSQQDIDKALEMIRHKFPLRRYPKVTLERVSFSTESVSHQLRAEDFHLSLVEGVNNDVVLSSLMTAGQFFVQLPSHPSYQCLTTLTQALTQLYSMPDQPQLSAPIKDAICVAPSMGGWYRAQIVAVSEDATHCDIKFLDYGGYMAVDTAALRQIRGDFMFLPFQAIECGLANVAPINEEGWGEDSRTFVHNLTFGRILQIQVCTYSEEGVPLVNVYTTLGHQVILLNHELVSQGYARFLEVIPAISE